MPRPRAPISPDEKRERRRAQSRAWYHRNAAAQRDSFLRRRYGIDSDAYDAMLAAQDGACAICGGGPTGHGRLHVDHDHGTGRVRGLLCYGCNYALGAFKDSPALLERAADYLRLEQHD